MDTFMELVKYQNLSTQIYHGRYYSMDDKLLQRELGWFL